MSDELDLALDVRAILFAFGKLIKKPKKTDYWSLSTILLGFAFALIVVSAVLGFMNQQSEREDLVSWIAWMFLIGYVLLPAALLLSLFEARREIQKALFDPYHIIVDDESSADTTKFIVELAAKPKIAILQAQAILTAERHALEQRIGLFVGILKQGGIVPIVIVVLGFFLQTAQPLVNSSEDSLPSAWLEVFYVTVILVAMLIVIAFRYNITTIEIGRFLPLLELVLSNYDEYSAANMVPARELFLHQEPTRSKLDEALRWAKQTPPQESDLDELERRLLGEPELRGD